ncbi:hypothetical protein GGI05_002845, partial [Coemansia sp. RSA 2603]
MEDSQYDEFGNYIGPELDSSSSSEDEQQDVEEEQTDRMQQRQASASPSDAEDDENAEEESSDKAQNLMAMMRRVDIAKQSPQTQQNQIVLHEDKVYYPSAEQVFGEDVEILVQEEDAQALDEPIIAPIKTRKFTVGDADDLPQTTYAKEFLVDLLGHPSFVRNLAVVGHLHHGKTTLVDLLVAATHEWSEWDVATPIGTPVVKMAKPNQKAFGFTDTLQLERQRGVSLKTTAMSMVVQDSREKSWAFNIADTPGHADFFDEVEAGLRLADGVSLAVDAIEGVMSGTRRAIASALRENLRITLVITKIDRLILELRLPPADAYHKLRLTVEEVNQAIHSHHTDHPRISPERGNVCFASASYGFCFTLHAFARQYTRRWQNSVDPRELAKRLWGDVYYSAERNAFVRKRVDANAPRSFVHFVLEPLYKMFAHITGEDAPKLRPLLESLGVRLRAKDYELNARMLLRRAFGQFFGPPAGLVDMCVQQLPSPVVNAEATAARLAADTKGPLAQAITACEATGPLVIAVAKQIAAADGQSFYILGRILSGAVTDGMNVRVLGESFADLDADADDEDAVPATVSGVWLSCARYRISVSGLAAGSWVMLSGVDLSIAKTATIVDANNGVVKAAVRSLQMPKAVVRVAVEPAVPSELPRMLHGLRGISKTYPASQTRVEESGEHVILGTGELYLDCILHDLRRVYAEIEIRVADPVVSFRECVSETSSVRVFADSPNRKNRITLIAEPLDAPIVEDIEQGAIDPQWSSRQTAQYFESTHGWDILAARSIWAFGPGSLGTNILSDDTLPADTDKARLRSVRDAIRQGFQWASREGPLCDEPMRATRFRILDATLADSVVHR